MATYRFRVWQSGSAPYEVTGNGLSWGYARDNVARREGVDVSDVMPINGNAPIDDDSSGSSRSGGGGDVMGSVMLLGAILLIGFVLTYWKWILIGGIIVGILWWWCKD